jgi:hypothetical protein
MAFTDRTKLSEYDATAANNINLGTAASPAARLGEYGVDLDAEAMRPSDTNGALRELMKHLKDMDAGTSALTAPNLGKPTLEAIDTSITATALDVFVYDTSKDSDGGAWRKRCQHTSWYNETLNTATRGSRREFPAVAVIVAEATKVTIYDGDDPALPMWIVFNGAVSHSIFLGYSSPGGFSVTMRDGHFCVGITGSSTNGSINGLAVANFVADTLSKYDEIGFAKSSQGIADRNDNAWLSGMGWWSIAKDTTKKIVNQYVNDVSLTVLPDAPIDPATGLPVPTIAVATDGGVSVIKDDGTVVDSAATSTPTKVSFNPEGLWYDETSSTRLYFATYADIASGDGFGDQLANSSAGTQEFDLIARPDKGLVSTSDSIAIGCVNSYLTSNRGLMLHQPNYTDQSKGMSALLTSTYNTGWMNGDIKGAFLSDTDDTDLVGGTDADRSVNNNPLTVNGTVTRTAVATGAELVGYSGLSASNYLEQPYNADLDFGTGDFCVMGWIKEAANSAVETILERDSATTAQRFTLAVDASGFLTFICDDDTTARTATSTIAIDNGTWTHFAATYDGAGGLRIYLNGALNDTETGAALLTLNNAAAVLRVGLAVDGAEPLTNGSLALLRISATDPTAEQIAKIYEDEKFLFQENAACTLYGASDSVTALAHDPDTNLLHVGTSAGRSVFQGLRRVDNTTTAVDTAISASGALVAEE